MSEGLGKEIILNEEEYQEIRSKLNSMKNTFFLKRSFDLIVALTMLILLFPFILIIAIWIVIGSGFPVFFTQERIGKDKKTFKIFKFRTMKNNSATKDGITMANDNRITKIGMLLRKYRLDELPQLFNIVKGDMSFVGPRPDLPKYYETRDYGYRCVLLVKPGVTGEATLEYKDEDKLLALSNHPEKTYTEEIFPEKVKLNIHYIENLSFRYDLKIMLRTFMDVFIR